MRTGVLYVRKDGTFLADEKPPLYLQCGYAYRSVPRLELSIVLERVSSNAVGYTINVKEIGSSEVNPAVIVFEDPASGKQVGLAAANIFNTLSYTKEQALALTPHKPVSEGSKGAGIDLPIGSAVRCILIFDGKKYASPVLRP